MAGLVAHQYILCKALRTYKNHGDILAKLTNSLKVALEYAKAEDGVGYSNYEKKRICVNAGFAHIGAVGPDLFYLEILNKMSYMADLMHYNKTGPYVIFGINELRNIETFNIKKMKFEELNMLAYYMGHASHIATDIVVHPLVNSLIGAYPDLKKRFLNSRDTGGIISMPLWRAHNIIEHYQDAYVLHHKYAKFLEVADSFFEKRNKPWKNIMIGIAAASAYQKYEDADKETHYFIVKNAIEYYNHKSNAKINTTSIEDYKFNFFLDANKLIKSSIYFDETIPDKITMDVWWKTDFVETSHFDTCINMAIDLTHKMWDEMLRYLVENPKINSEDDDFEVKSEYFPILQKHWNLDTGFMMSVNKELKLYNPEGSNNKDIETHLVELFFKNYTPTEEASISKEVSASEVASPPSPPYTVQKGDNLSAIAQKHLGNSDRYQEIYDLNKDMIDAENKGTGNTKYTIYPGQTLKMP